MQTTVLTCRSKGVGKYLMLHFSTPLFYTVRLFAQNGMVLILNALIYVNIHDI